MKTNPNQKDITRTNRINKTIDLIRSKQLSGRLNNTKWREIFEILESFDCAFRIKLLTDSEESISNEWNTNIIELEGAEFLTNNYAKYGFILFKEIERIDIKSDSDFESLRSEIETLSKTEIQMDQIISVNGYFIQNNSQDSL